MVSNEVLGVTCIDGGKCHHQCKDKCFQRESCAPFSDYNGPWEYPQPKRQPMSDQDKLHLITNWFSEDWAIERARRMLDDYEWMIGQTSKPE